MIIDCNMHHLPEDLFTNDKIMEGFLTTAPRGFGEIATLETLESGKKHLILEKPQGYHNLDYVEGDYSLEAKLKAMDEAGVDKALLRVPVWQEWLRLDTCKIVNDNAADMCRRSNGRLYANAVLPPWGGKENLYELERCLKELGIVGVQLACHYGQLYLDDEAFKPYLKVLNETGVPVIVHHTPLPVYWQSTMNSRICGVNLAVWWTRLPLWAGSFSAVCSKNSRTSNSSTRCLAETGLPIRN